MANQEIPKEEKVRKYFVPGLFIVVATASISFFGAKNMWFTLPIIAMDLLAIYQYTKNWLEKIDLQHKINALSRELSDASKDCAEAQLALTQHREALSREIAPTRYRMTSTDLNCYLDRMESK